MSYKVSPFAELSVRLSSLTEFIDAIEDLRSLMRLTSSHLTSHPRKLIALVEVAKCTLKNAGILIRTFASCPSGLRGYKDAYFNLLRELRSHVNQLRLESENRDLQVRLSRLLLPLSSPLVFSTESRREQVGGDNILQGTASPRSASISRSGRQGHQKPSFPPNAMPPPQDLPPPRVITSTAVASGLARPHREMRFFDPPSSPEAQSRGATFSGHHERGAHQRIPGEDSRDDMDLENSEPLVMPRLARRQTFGIFCTGRGRGAMSGDRPKHKRSMSVRSNSSLHISRS